MGVRLRNMMPHRLVVLDEHGEPLLSVEPSGQVLRVPESTTFDRELACAGAQVPVMRVLPTKPPAPPGPDDGTYLLVPRLYAKEWPERSDLLFPYDEVRDDQGQILGCRALGTFGEVEGRDPAGMA